MKYLLIYLVSQFQQPGASHHIEFDDLPACKVAAAEMVKQAKRNPRSDISFPVLVCTPKGTEEARK